MKPRSVPLSFQVSFQHETYPSGPSEKPVLDLGEQPLARQVFIVQDLEIRDRLASSQINKFLYLYSSERMPRRTHSNMVRRLLSRTQCEKERFWSAAQFALWALVHHRAGPWPWPA